jgi:hypothetical protein
MIRFSVFYPAVARHRRSPFWEELSERPDRETDAFQS